MLKSIEICAGAGGQALGLEKAGFEHVALVEIEKPACETLRANRPEWNVIEGDVHEYGSANGREDIIEQLDTLIAGKRLKDISDLPLDLCL